MDFASVQLVSVFIQFIPEQNVLIPERNGVVPERNGLFVQRNALLLERNELIPEQNALISAQNSLVPEGSAVIPKGSAVIPKGKGVIRTKKNVYDGPCHSDTEDDMKSQSLGETLSGSGLMVAGLKVNIDKLKRRGLDEDFVASLEGLNKTVGELNAEQEALKSRLKEKTAQIDEAVASLKDKLSEARKVIKLELPQTGWKEFGITDVR